MYFRFHQPEVDKEVEVFNTIPENCRVRDKVCSVKHKELIRNIFHTDRQRKMAQANVDADLFQLSQYTSLRAY